MIGWCSRDMAERGLAGSNNRMHADPTCTGGPDPMVQVDVRDGLLFPSTRQSKGVRVKWCVMCERPEVPGVWARRGACVGADTDLFFPQPRQGPSAAWLYRRAKQICDGCNVLEECRAFAVAHEPGFGMWGGLTPHGREKARLAIEEDAASIVAR